MDHCTGVGQRSDVNGSTVLMVRILHRDELYRHGDINVTSPGKKISPRRIAGLKRKRAHDEPLWCRIGQAGWLLIRSRATLTFSRTAFEVKIAFIIARKEIM